MRLRFIYRTFSSIISSKSLLFHSYVANKFYSQLDIFFRLLLFSLSQSRKNERRKRNCLCFSFFFSFFCPFVWFSFASATIYFVLFFLSSILCDFLACHSGAYEMHTSRLSLNKFFFLLNLSMSNVVSSFMEPLFSHRSGSKYAWNSNKTIDRKIMK